MLNHTDNRTKYQTDMWLHVKHVLNVKWIARATQLD